MHVSFAQISQRTRLWSFVGIAGLAVVVSTGCGGRGGGSVVPATADHAVHKAQSSKALGTEATNPVPTPPAGEAYFGARVNPGYEPSASPIPVAMPSGRYQEQQTEALEGQIGRRLATDMHYYPFRGIDSGTLEGDPSIAGDLAYGRIPVISLACPSAPDHPETLAALAANLASPTPAPGVAPNVDQQTVMTAATAIKNLNAPVFVRFFWEFNIDLNNEGRNGDGKCFSSTALSKEEPEFINAWKALVNAFKADGATNIAWLWNPTGDLADATNWSDIEAFYPTGYVDWVGVDAYPTTGDSFSSTIGAFYTNITGYANTASMPILVGETAALGANSTVKGVTTTGGVSVQTTYLSGALSSLSSNTFPNIKGFMYFDAEPNSYDWPLTYPTDGPASGSLSAFASMGSNPYFSPGTYSKTAPSSPFYTTNAVSGESGSDLVYAFNAFSTGNPSPIGTITGPAPSPRPYILDAMGIATDQFGNLFVANTTYNDILEFPFGASESGAAKSVISGPNTELEEPAPIAVDAQDNVYTLGNTSNGQAVFEFANAPNGDPTPSAEIPSNGNAVIGSQLEYPSDIAVAPNGSVYVVNTMFVSGASELPGSIVEFAPLTPGAGVTGTMPSPSAVLTGSATLLNYPISIGLDEQQNMYVLTRSSNGANTGLAINVYAAGASGNTPPLYTIAGPLTMMAEPFMIRVDALGGVYLVDRETPAVYYYAPLQQALLAPQTVVNEAPLRVYSGSNFAGIDEIGVSTQSTPFPFTNIW